MSNRAGAPSSAEVEEKKRLAEKLKAEKAAKERAIQDLESQLKAQKHEVASALAYLDKLAKEHEAKLTELKKVATPEAKAEAQRIEAKLGLYRTVRSAAGRFEESMGTGNLATFASTALSLRLAEGEAVIANSKLVLGDLAGSIEVLKSALGQPAKVPPPQMPTVNQIKARVKASPQLNQQLNAAIHFYHEAQAAAGQEEINLNQLRGMSGKEAVQFAANTMKITQLAGKINHLRNLHQTFANEPTVKALFPEPIEITIPKLPPGMKPQKAAGKPLTGILLDILGLNKDKS